MKPWIMPLLPRCIMVKLGGNTGRLNSSRLYSVWIKHGHFADAKPCGKSMDKSRRLDIVHRFATLDHPLTTLRQGKIMRKSLTKNSTTTNTYRVIFSSRNHMKTTQEIVLFSPVFCPTIGGRFTGLVNVAVKNHIIIPFQRLLIVMNHVVIVRFVREINSET